MPEKKEIAARLVEQLTRAKELRLSSRCDPKAAEARARLRAWQSVRLARTHADLLKDPRFGDAASFFLAEIYGAHDAGERDAEVERVVPVMTRLLPEAGLETVADAIELDALSEDLDAAVVKALGGRADRIDAAAYGRAYRKVGRQEDRKRQLDLIQSLGRSLDRLTHQPFLAGTLKLMRRPAKLAGLGDLQSFLERGYAAFRKMGGAEEFLNLVIARESKLSDALFAGDDRLLKARGESAE
jgi:hypothetical protein